MHQLEFFRLFHNVGQPAYELLVSQFKTRNYKKGELIVEERQVQKDLLFVVKGVQMSYFDAEKKQHVIAFTYPPNLCAIPESFMFQKPSPYYLQCLTDSEFNYISFEKLQQLFDQSHDLERLFRKMTEAVLAGMINRHIELHSLSIEDRYRIFTQRSAFLLQLVPHKYIASYLHIDPTNFSKLFNTVRI
jgi:CRP-like cAMP-binding protein